MDLSNIDTLINAISLLGGGGIGVFFTWRWQRAKAKSEALGADASAAKELQDVYQQLITDVKTDRDEQKAYINELKEDRQHLRRDRDELRDRIDKTEEVMRNLQREVARNGRMVESMRPFMCGDLACKKRRPALISPTEESEITPYGPPHRNNKMP